MDDDKLNKLKEIRPRVEKVNEELLELGYSWGQIFKFWQDTIKEAALKDLKKDKS